MAGSVTSGLGPRQAAVLEHLQEHPCLTANELARVFGLRASLYKQMEVLEQRALVVGEQVFNPNQGRRVTVWNVAPPGTVPPPRSAPDPVAVQRRRERETAAQRARRARRNPPRRVALPAAPPTLPAAVCKDADPDLFFGPELEFVMARRKRVAEAKAICAGCPERLACLAWALDTREAYGVWGGADEDERRAMLRQRRAS
jgi:WhiB family transcriptional regulator, redox-sensing transcriptional regulator